MEENNYIEEELKELAPLLIPLQKKNPFTLPEGYFLHLLAVTMRTIGLKEKEEVDDNKNSSAETGNRHPFSLPENYFENLPAAVLEKIRVEQRQGRPISGLRPLSMKWLLAAASVAFILFLSVLNFHNKKSEPVAAIEPMDTIALMLEYAAGLPEAVVVDYYSLRQDTLVEDSSANQYLIDAVFIDPEVIFSL